ncbi:hypothetical protein GOV12_02840 [Candidatus Pacearchaeota archaeon]|nr:hypothetical protein [Candidatus Pacearchaeota archaeon]
MGKKGKYEIFLIFCILLIGLSMPLISAGVLQDIVNVGDTIIDLLGKLFSFGDKGDSEMDAELGNIRASADEPEINVIPNHTELDLGYLFYINISVDNVTDLYGFQFDLTYDSPDLEFVDIVNGDFLNSDGNNVFFSYTFNTMGLIDNIYATRTGPVSGMSGSGVLATLRFIAQGNGDRNIGLSETQLIDSGVNQIVHNINNGTVKILNCIDEDWDGYYVFNAINCSMGDDCNDTMISGFNIHPGATEFFNGIDDNCNGEIDEGFECVDNDNDGYNASTPFCFLSDDCDDDPITGPLINPGATEICDGLDNDCDFDTDNVINPELCIEQDGVCSGSVKTCGGFLGWFDCDSGNYGPLYQAFETTCDGEDNDCDGVVDEGCACIDEDLDGYDSIIPMCPTGNDCDDNPITGFLINPGATEICDGIDNDCDFNIDNNLALELCDLTLGVCEGSQKTCEGFLGWKDCEVFVEYGPEYEFIETSCDNLDNDCDGETDEGCCEDLDGDGYDALSPVCFSGNDCNDNPITGPLINPGATEICDGIDNNCDFETDNNLTPELCALTQGVCANSQKTCGGFLGWFDCQTFQYGPMYEVVETTCDTFDNDCDGVVDNLNRNTACGVGACFMNTGIETCIAGSWGSDTCDPFAGATSDANCNGADDDCDGEIDDDYSITVTTCGVGECFGNIGTLSCLGGFEFDSCNNLSGAVPELCEDGTAFDGLDNDCDGEIDELDCDNFCDIDGDGHSSNILCLLWGPIDDCDDFDEDRFPGNPEICDNKDNDCNFLTNDGINEVWYNQETNCGSGVCANTGNLLCIGGISNNNCVNNTPTGIDNDCNSLDDNCNGLVDENYLETTSFCGLGECLRNGTQRCINGVEDDDCTSGNPGIETCNSLDDDCDGIPDNNLAPELCDLTQGVCSGTEKICGGFGWFDCNSGTYGPLYEVSETLCDGEDNDCDGATDEGCPCIQGQTRDCGNDVGLCVFGTQTCSIQGEWGACIGGQDPVNEVCDLQDNDCDGVNDNGVLNTYYRDVDTDGFGNLLDSIQSCTPSIGYVSNSNDCNDGNISIHPNALDDDCNGVDNDCDSSIDEDYVSVPTTCGVGECFGNTGEQICVGGVLDDTCDETENSVPEICGNETGYDLLDNNCDGTIDLNCNSFCDVDGDGYSSNFLCIFHNFGDCDDTNGNINSGMEDLCNNIDDDCNLLTLDGFDEIWYDEETNCGTGVCANTGNRICVDGLMGDSCTVGSQTGDDSDCDSLDDNCNGEVDENYIESIISCGIGICERNGIKMCVSGSEDDVCISGNPGIETCNSLDDDCDGIPDNNFALELCDNQVGYCKGSNKTCGGISGWTSCNSISYGPLYQVNEVTCDGYDNDCDGIADEGCPYCAISEARFSTDIIKNNTPVNLLVNTNNECVTSTIHYKIFDQNNNLIGNISVLAGVSSYTFIPKSNVTGLYEIYFISYPTEDSSLNITSTNLIVKPDLSLCYMGSLASLKDTIFINNNNNLSVRYNETKVPVRYDKNNKTAFNLLMDCTFDKINLNVLNVSFQENDSNRGYTIVNNLNLSGKDMFVDRKNNSNRLCIKDISNINDLNVNDANCNSSNGVIINCPGTKDQYSCSIFENRYLITNLSHSAVFELEALCGDSLCNGNEACGSCPGDCGACTTPPGGQNPGGSSPGGGTNPVITINTNNTNASANVSQPQVEENQSNPPIIDYNQSENNQTELDKNIFDNFKDNVVAYIILVIVAVILAVAAMLIIFYIKWKKEKRINSTKIKLKDNFK